MLATLGVQDVSELWSTIPDELVRREPLELPPVLRRDVKLAASRSAGGPNDSRPIS